MYEEQLAAFSRQRLDGRPLPDDLRTMLVAQWEGRTDISDLVDLVFFEPEQEHPLLDTGYLSEKELADPEMQAVNAGYAELSKYVKLVAEGGKGWIGYWLHPQVPEGSWPVVELDTEFSFWTMAGRNLAEACIADRADDEEDESARAAVYSETARELEELGVPCTTYDYDELYDPEYPVGPEELAEEFIDAERVRRGIG